MPIMDVANASEHGVAVSADGLGDGAASHHNVSGDQLHGLDNHTRQPPPVKSLLAFYVVMICMVGLQSTIFWWKKKHKRSYELVTLMGLWLVPAYMGLQMKCYRFLTVWLLYSAVTAYILYQASQKKMSSSTPRMVYSWFLGVYRVSVVLGLAGYLLCVLQMIDPMVLLIPAGMPFLLLWYGLYFGILGRDAAEVASDRMAAVMGTGRRLMVSVKSCGMCAGDLPDFGVPAAQVPATEQTVTLPCKHSFHRQCLQGWTIVGKKDTCPQCLEKVDLRQLYADKPWQTKNLNWIQMLDAVRYMVVWLPAILTVAHVALHLLGLDPPAKQVAKAAGAHDGLSPASLQPLAE